MNIPVSRTRVVEDGLDPAQKGLRGICLTLSAGILIYLDQNSVWFVQSFKAEQ